MEMCFGCFSLENKKNSNNLDNSERNTLLFRHFGFSITGITKFESQHAQPIPHIFAFDVTLINVSFGVFDWFWMLSSDKHQHSWKEL